MTRLVRAAALAYLLFVIYGSLVPLNFQSVALTDALERFSNIPFLNLGVGSRADWVANLLLFIPLSFLLAASLWPRGRSLQILTTTAIALFCVALSVTIEFLQIFFPPRTVSQNDIFAESLGAIFGLTGWWVWGERSIAWLASWQRIRGAANLAEKLLWAYLAMLFVYNVLPLDLTISVVEIYHKWSEGRINLIPFAETPKEPILFLYEVTTDALIWLPVSLLICISGRGTPHQAVRWTLSAVLLLEGLQLVVYSRHSDVTDLITAVPGALLGVWLAGQFRLQARHAGPAVKRVRAGSRAWPIAGLAVAWCVLLAAVFWHPFNFSTDSKSVTNGIDAFFSVPFKAYYFGTELRAITEVLRKTAFFLPLGALLAWYRWSTGNRGPLGLLDAAVVAGLLVPPLVIELGQIALPGKFPGSTDVVLEWLGASVGYLGFVALARRWSEHDAPRYAPQIDARRPHNQSFRAQPNRPDLNPFALTAIAWTLLLLLSSLASPGTLELLPAASAETDHNIFPILWAISVTAALAFLARRPLPWPFISLPWRTELTPWLMAVAVVAMVVLPPWQPTSALRETLGGEFGNPAQRLYALLKSVILWVPLGFIGSVAGVGRRLAQWTLAGAITFALLYLPLLNALSVGDLYEVLAAPLGAGLGVWLAQAAVPSNKQTTRFGNTFATPAGAIASTAPEPPPRAATAPAAPPAYAQGYSPASEVQQLPFRSLVAFTPPRVLALAMLFPTLLWAWQMPRFGQAMVIGLVTYFAVMLRYPNAWLVIIPWALPALDLAPWTGRFYFDEFDMLLLVSLAGAVWHWTGQRGERWMPTGVRVAAALFGLSCLLSMFLGLLPLQELDANAFSSYRSHFNALRVAKGFAWAAVLIAILRWQRHHRSWQIPLLTGMSLGLVTVGLVGVWERWLFADLWDFSVEYRVITTFSSMHVGGAHIEAYLVLALPVAAHFLRTAERPMQITLASTALILGTFVLISTVARGALLGLAAAALVLAAGFFKQKSQWTRRRGSRFLRSTTSTAVVLLAGTVLAIGVGGSYFQKRLESSFQDLDTRLNHWRETLSIIDSGIGTALFGMGLGQFPDVYLLRANPHKPPGTYRFDSAFGDRYLALGAGETLYFTQRVSIEPNSLYHLKLRVKTAGEDAVLNTTLCERHLSHSRRCVWPKVTIPSGGEWHNREIDIPSREIGLGSFPHRAPVDFALYNSSANTVVFVDDLRLTDAEGRELLRNGGFDAGSDYWFIKTHEHLSWHVKQLALQIYFEQGLVGLTLFTVLTLMTFAHLWRGVLFGDGLTLAVLAGLAGFLAIGLVGSLFDAPRLTLMYFGLTGIGIWHLERKQARA